MSKKIFRFGFVLLIMLSFVRLSTNSVLAEDETPPEVVDETTVTLVSIAITAPADKLEYLVEDELDISGLEVTGTYNDESTAPVEISETDISGFDSGAPAKEQTLTITVEGQTVTYNITILILAAENDEESGDTEEDPPISVEAGIVLQNGCEVENNTGETHMFPKDTDKEYLAICAFEAALEQDIIDEIEFVDFGFGLFIQSVNGIAPENTYWKLEHNGTGAAVGAAELELEADDVVSLVLTEFDPVTFEEEPLGDVISLTIESLDPVFHNITLPDHCSITDTAGLVHTFPEDTSVSEYLAVCAIAEALQSGHLSGFELSDSSFGLFLQSVNSIAPGATEFWALWHNGGFAGCGVECLPLSAGNTLSLILTDWMAGTESTNIPLRIIALISSPEEEDGGGEPPSGGGGGGGNEDAESAAWNTDSAVAYLKSVQGADGSFANSELYTDWAAVAYGVTGVVGNAKSSLVSYMRSHNSISSLLTDNERRAMALLALGEDPYSFGGVNYIGAIIGDFDGTQFGDSDLVNDDIFALIPLASSGYDEDDEIIGKAIAFILSKQKSNGSWEGSVDIAAAAIQALIPFDSVDGISDALEAAEAYLVDKQEDDGGWGDVFATSWVLQAESALDTSWTKDGKSGFDYLGEKQADAKNNGAILPSSESQTNVIWATSYAIPAGLGKPWGEILESVSRPEESSGGSSSEGEEEEDDAPTTNESPVAEISTAVLLERETIPAFNILQSPDPEPTIIFTAETEEPKVPPDDSVEKIAPETLTAGALNALPSSDYPIPQNLPLILGGASGIILLYGVAKLFIL